MTEISEVGCRECKQGGQWKIFSDGRKVVKAECRVCRHSVDIDTVEIKGEPDSETFPLWMFT